MERFSVEDFVSYDVMTTSGITKKVIGQIMEIFPANFATVRLATPVEPTECAGCGAPPFSLSVNGATGEVVCTRSGCGHEHGFITTNVKLPLSKLTNTTLRQKAERRGKFLAHLSEVLQQGLKDNYITEEEHQAILRAVGKSTRAR